MPNATRVNAIRKQLALDGADPFVVAAEAIERAERYKQRLTEIENLLQSHAGDGTAFMRLSAVGLPQRQNRHITKIPFPA